MDAVLPDKQGAIHPAGWMLTETHIQLEALYKEMRPEFR